MLSKICKKINNFIFNRVRNKRKIKSRKFISVEKHDLFKNNGEGIYLHSFYKKDSNDFVSNQISKFSNGYVHTFITLYSENLKEYFTRQEWTRLCSKWKYYYNTEKNIDFYTKTLVLGSADIDGINYFDYANYQDRKQIIHKIPMSVKHTDSIIRFLVSEKVMNANYDYVGLALFPICRQIYSKDDYFCSGLASIAYREGGYSLSKEYRPSPYEIVASNKDYIIYRSCRKNTTLKSCITSQ